MGGQRKHLVGMVETKDECSTTNSINECIMILRRATHVLLSIKSAGENMKLLSPLLSVHTNILHSYSPGYSLLHRVTSGLWQLHFI